MRYLSVCMLILIFLASCGGPAEPASWPEQWARIRQEQAALGPDVDIVYLGVITDALFEIDGPLDIRVVLRGPALELRQLRYLDTQLDEIRLEAEAFGDPDSDQNGTAMREALEIGVIGPREVFARARQDYEEFQRLVQAKITISASLFSRDEVPGHAGAVVVWGVTILGPDGARRELLLDPHSGEILERKETLK
jgi:hypothetical protein